MGWMRLRRDKEKQPKLSPENIPIYRSAKGKNEVHGGQKRKHWERVMECCREAE